MYMYVHIHVLVYLSDLLASSFLHVRIMVNHVYIYNVRTCITYVLYL